MRIAALDQDMAIEAIHLRNAEYADAALAFWDGKSKGTEFTIHMKVRVNEYIPAPIFAFSMKNIMGTEITGTNSMIEKAYLESVEPGQVKEVTFTQKMSLQGGEYLLSLGVTGFNKDVFEVYHRLYDVLNITVVSDKNTVGYYDMDSCVKVADV